MFLLIPLQLLFVSLISATALTFKLNANEKQCFFADVVKQNSKVAFYFAVQSGGSFDIDYTVYGPNERLIMQGSKERQGDFVFSANDWGEYRFCFDNDMSTFAEKKIDFEIAVSSRDGYGHGGMRIDSSQVENEDLVAKLPTKEGSSPDQTNVIEESIVKIASQLSTINRFQKYFRTRENRNFSTVRSTERRIFNFSVMESLMMVTMAGLQIFVVRFFFTGARKGYV